MFWRFGFGNTSAIDTLLDRDNVTLEDLLVEDELLPECKAQNTKLIEFLNRREVIVKLLTYLITPSTEESTSRYAYLCSEMLCAEIWPVIETICDDSSLLHLSWVFLERPAPLDSQIAMYFSKVWSVFLQKKTRETLGFIQGRGSAGAIVHTFLRHIGTSAVMDLLLKVISLEELPDGQGVVEWLNDQGLMEALIDRMHPDLDPDVHATAAQVLLDIITISQSSNPEQPTIGTNSLIKELKSERLVTMLVDYMLDQVAPHSTSTLVNGVAIIIELIRRNYSELDEEGADVTQQVDLSDLIRMLSRKLPEFQNLLRNPKSATVAVETTVGKQIPLGFERLRVCELFAELLHLSNMGLLNVLPAFVDSVEQEEADGVITSTATIPGELPAIAGLATAGLATAGLATAGLATIEENDASPTATLEEPSTPFDGHIAVIEEVGEPAVSTESAVGADQAEDAQTAAEALLELSENYIVPTAEARASRGSRVLSDNIKTEISDDVSENHVASEEPAPSSVDVMPSQRKIVHQETDVPTSMLIPGISAGEALKLSFIETGIIPTCLELFFQYPWNNFLHTVVYDMIHQVLNLPLDNGVNTRLIVSLFTDAKITERITEAQRECDHQMELPKGVRLGYMGHLTFIAEQVVRLLERSGSELKQHFEAEDWDEYVRRTLRETKERDQRSLGGHRPNQIEGIITLESDDDEDVLPGGGDADVASDQFARYLVQQITNDLPDKFGLEDDAENATNEWINDELEKDMNEFEKDMDFDFQDPFSRQSRDEATDAVMDSLMPLAISLEDSDDEDEDDMEDLMSEMTSRKKRMSISATAIAALDWDIEPVTADPPPPRQPDAESSPPIATADAGSEGSGELIVAEDKE